MPKNEETRRRILEVALKLFASSDFHKVNMRAVASVAEIGLSTIYGYFESKESLLTAVIDLSLDGFAKELEPDLAQLASAEGKLREIVRSSLNFMDSCPELGSVLFLTVPLRVWAGRDFFRRQDRTYRLLADVVTDGQRAGEIRSEVSPITVFDTIFGLVARQVVVSTLRGDKRPVAEYADTISDIVCRAFLAQAPMSGPVRRALDEALRVGVSPQTTRQA